MVEDEPGQKAEEVGREGTLLRKTLVGLSIAVGAVLVLALLLVSLGFALHWYLSPQTDLSISQRQALVQGLASAGQALAVLLTGAVALIGLYLTRQNTNKQLRQARDSTQEQLQQARESQERTQASAQETLRLTEQGQITERFTRAIDQLGATDDDGNKLFEIRLGGIYALERIARESEEDYWPIMEVLTAYVRQHAPWRPEEGQRGEADAAVEEKSVEDSSGESETTEEPIPDPDIQAIMTVLRRRTRSFGRGEPEPLDLHQTNLSVAYYLWGANLSRADLSEANLSGANLSGANLSQAVLERANLSIVARKDRTWITNLTEANLREAHLSGANLLAAMLAGANLSGANLSGARNLAQRQLEQANGDVRTQLPAGLKRPAHWGGGD